jgi:hypothetical protein
MLNPTYKKNVFCIWRIDGEFMFTQIPTAGCPTREESNDEWVKAAIRAEYEPRAFEESEIRELIETATNYEHPEFLGYEIIAIFETDEMPGFIY